MLIDIALYATAGLLILYLALNLALYLYLRWYLNRIIQALREWDEHTPR